MEVRIIGPMAFYRDTADDGRVLAVLVDQAALIVPTSPEETEEMLMAEARRYAAARRAANHRRIDRTPPEG